MQIVNIRFLIYEHKSSILHKLCFGEAEGVSRYSSMIVIVLCKLHTKKIVCNTISDPIHSNVLTFQIVENTRINLISKSTLCKSTFLQT